MSTDNGQTHLLKDMKRNLFAELTEGFDALKAERKGKRTLRTHAIEKKPVPTVTAKELMRVRAKLNLSRAVFARYLTRTSSPQLLYCL